MSGLSRIFCRPVPMQQRVFRIQQRKESDSRKQGYCCNFDDVRAASKAIKPYIRRTPVVTSAHFNNLSGRKLLFKAENMQSTGSFKIRGAMYAVLKLKSKFGQPKCLITHSSGNHGQALAKAAQHLNVPCYVVMPKSSSECKVQAVEHYGAKVITCPDTINGREEVSSQVFKKYSGIFVHPSQTPSVIAGQGTLGMEIMEQDCYIDTVIAPVGGGGLISGLAIAIKSINPEVRIIAAEPENANDCEISKQNGMLTPMNQYPDTVADGARINVGRTTWPIIRDLVDDVITVSEDEIKSATLQVWQRLKLVIEPTSGVAVAAAISEKFQSSVGGNYVGVILCGGNVDLSSFMLTCSE